MKKCKKLLSVVVILCMLAQFLGCKPDTNASDFDEFINNVHLELFSSSDYNLLNKFKDKTSFGFDNEGIIFKFTSKEKFYKQMNKYEELLDKLKDFNYLQLSDEQKLNYDILKDYLKRQLVVKDDYKYYYSNNARLTSEFTLMLLNPLYIRYDKKKDFDLILKILKDVTDSFDDVYELSKFQMENNIILKEDVEKLIEDFDNVELYMFPIEMMTNSTLYTEEEKAQYIDKYNELYEKCEKLSNSTKEKVQKLYETYKDNLNTENKYKVSPLSQSKEGKTYYRHLLQNVLGTQVLSVEQLLAELKLNATKTKIQLDKICKETGKKPSYNTFDDSLKISDFYNNEQIISYLENNYSKYFPSLPKLNYTIETGDYEPGFVAGYYGTYIDTPLENHKIGIGGQYAGTNYFILAHEGFPGHMYQTAYNYLNDVPTFRKMITQLSYTEGWAKYIDKYVLNFMPIEDTDDAKLRVLSTEYERYNRCILDIYVNYYGWSYEQFEDYYMSVMPKDDDECFTKRQFYEEIIDRPCYHTMNYPLYAGYFEDLYNQAKFILGDKFDPVEFHKVILDCAPAGIDIIREQVNKYIFDKKLNK